LIENTWLPNTLTAAPHGRNEEHFEHPMLAVEPSEQVSWAANRPPSASLRWPTIAADDYALTFFTFTSSWLRELEERYYISLALGRHSLIYAIYKNSIIGHSHRFRSFWHIAPPRLAATGIIERRHPNRTNFCNNAVTPALRSSRPRDVTAYRRHATDLNRSFEWFLTGKRLMICGF
jgi:hypothetical protein